LNETGVINASPTLLIINRLAYMGHKMTQLIPLFFIFFSMRNATTILPLPKVPRTSHIPNPIAAAP
jgi:hypothetical protein